MYLKPLTMRTSWILLKRVGAPVPERSFTRLMPKDSPEVFDEENTAVMKWIEGRKP